MLLLILFLFIMNQHMKNKENENENKNKNENKNEIDKVVDEGKAEVVDEGKAGVIGDDKVVGEGEGEGKAEVVGEGKGDGEVVKQIGIRKKIRNYIVNKNVESIKRSGIPLDLACLFIKIIHFRMPFDIMLMAYFSSPFVSLCLWITVMSIFSCFILLDGCVLSVIEYKLTGNSLNVMDIFLWLFGYDIHYKNRYNATIIAAIIYLLLFFSLVWNKGGVTYDNFNKLLYYGTFSYFTKWISL